MAARTVPVPISQVRKFSVYSSLLPPLSLHVLFLFLGMSASLSVQCPPPCPSNFLILSCPCHFPCDVLFIAMSFSQSLSCLRRCSCHVIFPGIVMSFFLALPCPSSWHCHVLLPGITMSLYLSVQCPCSCPCNIRFPVFATSSSLFLLCP